MEVECIDFKADSVIIINNNDNNNNNNNDNVYCIDITVQYFIASHKKC